ncbi:MAG: ABC transporter ATP-binding protein [Pseudomonadota bacterium]
MHGMMNAVTGDSTGRLAARVVHRHDAANSKSDARPGKLRIEGLRKTYGAVTALDDIDLTMREGEFLTLLGPSGSGKSTLLWAVAGLNDPDGGRIWIDGREATHAAPQDRDIGMVFQNYALFPHLTVAENIGFPLRMRGRSGGAGGRAVERVLDTVQLGHTRDRLPAELSGGQQQRIALARALVYEPSIVLMDEPLGALDKKLRDHLQIEIKALHARLGVTILYVTHDQEEALVMSDRICLMNHAAIEQLGTPDELYRTPATLFAADFLGESNLLPVTLDSTTPNQVTTLSGQTLRCPAPTTPMPGGLASLMVRPDALTCLVSPDGPEGWNMISGTLDETIMAGAISKLFVRLADGSRMQVNVLTGAAGRRPAPGEPVTLGWPAEAGVLLPGRPDAGGAAA